MRKLTTPFGLVDLTSNDYLGFARKLGQSIGEEFQTGSTGSRLLTGNSSLCEELEQTIAHFHGAEAGLIFNSGYSANLGLLSSIIQREDTIIHDTSVHASTHEGIAISRARTFPFRHQDVDHLEMRLKKASMGISRHLFVLIESIYSLDGSIAPLKDIAHLCQKYNANLIVDEAHATGIFGPRGEGLTVQLKCEELVFARIHTFGKALGAFGAIVVGSELLRNYLINFSLPFIYTTALPPQIFKTIQAAYLRLPLATQERSRLRELSLYFQKTAALKDVAVKSYGTPTIAYKVPGNEKVRELSQILENAGLDVRPLMSPTVQRGEESLRICLHAFNQEEEIDHLFDILEGSACAR